MGKINKSIEELSKEGWEDIHVSYAGFDIYKNGDKRILYDSKNQIIYLNYSTIEQK